MPRIELDISEQEKDTLIRVLGSYISDLNMEIADTDLMDFREKLKAERTTLRKIKKELEEHKLIPS